MERGSLHSQTLLPKLGVQVLAVQRIRFEWHLQQLKGEQPVMQAAGLLLAAGAEPLAREECAVPQMMLLGASWLPLDKALDWGPDFLQDSSAAAQLQTRLQILLVVFPARTQPQLQAQQPLGVSKAAFSASLRDGHQLLHEAAGLVGHLYPQPLAKVSSG